MKKIQHEHNYSGGMNDKSDCGECGKDRSTHSVLRRVRPRKVPLVSVASRFLSSDL